MQSEKNALVSQFTGLLVAAPLLFVSAQLWAQGPDAGALMREQPTDWGDPGQLRTLPTLPDIEKTPDHPGEEVRIPLNTFHITGASLIPESELQAQLAHFIRREATAADLHRAADTLANYYRNKGYLARVYLPEQVIDDGQVTLAVVEARLSDIEIEARAPERRIPREYARRVLETQSIGQPLDLNAVNRMAALLDETPGMDASLLLQPGEKQGETRLMAQLEGKPAIRGRIHGDNFGSNAAGEERGGIELTLPSPTGRGDRLSLAANTSGRNHFGRLAYSLPVGAQGWRVGGNVSYLDYRLGSEFSALDADGNALTVGLDASYPIWLGQAHNLRFLAGLQQRHYEDFRLGEAISDRQVTAGTLSLSGDILDSFGAGGLTLYSLNLVGGDVRLNNDAEKLADENTTDRAGSYAKLTGRLSRLQLIAPEHTLWLSISGQVTNGNLDSSEQAGLGGPSRVRAYPILEGSGDESLFFTAEWRYRIAQPAQLRFFYDHGQITRHKDTWDGWNVGNPDLGNRYELKGAGLGVDFFLPAAINARLDVAWRLGENPARDPVTGDDADGNKRDPRVWFSLNKEF